MKMVMARVVRGTFLALILLAGFWVLRPRLAEYLTPEAIVTRVRQEAKFVVLTRYLSTQIDARSSDEDLWEWAKSKLSRTLLRVRISECKVQYAVDLGAVKASDLRVNTAEKSITLELPPPRLDESMVLVPVDPIHWSFEQSGGWLRWDRGAIEDRIRRQLEAHVRQEARRIPLERGDILAAQESVEKLLTGLLKATGQPVLRVCVTFRGV